jgi:hypothetical protein
MFRDDLDREKFLEILERYLSRNEHKDSRGRAYRNLRDQVRLVSFCLMTTHFHLVLFQIRPGGIETLMRSVLTGYGRYFHARHGTTRGIFDDRYRAVPAKNHRQKLVQISYVHDNHGDDCMCRFCSHRLYVGDPDDVPSWVDVRSALALFGGRGGYERFRRTRAVQRELAGG